MYDIYCRTGIVIPFPIIADRSGEIARKYGMIASDISNTATVRNVFIIDDKQIVRSILVYPMNIGRSIPEILRIVRALQVADENQKMAPANWMPCDPMIMPMPQTFSELQCRTKQIEDQRNGMSWYLAFKNPEKCKLEENKNLEGNPSFSLENQQCLNRSENKEIAHSKENLNKNKQK